MRDSFFSSFIVRISQRLAYFFVVFSVSANGGVIAAAKSSRSAIFVLTADFVFILSVVFWIIDA